MLIQMEKRMNLQKPGHLLDGYLLLWMGLHLLVM